MKLDNFMLESTVQLSKIISSQIAKVKIYVLYAGKNRNYTHFSKAMIEEKLVPSMYGMPIIGEFIKEKEDFGGHGGKTTITENGIQYEPTTVAYGFIPESSQMRWESVKELNGTYRDYLVCDAYVWYKRFPELEVLLEEPRNQSMEIEIKDAYWNEGLQSYDITDAELSGCCILGLSTEPCFESAKIGRFSLEKMKYDLAEMAQELKEAIKSEVKTEVKEFENMEVEEVATKRLPEEDENIVVVEEDAKEEQEDSQEPEQDSEKEAETKEEAESDSSEAEEEVVEEPKESAQEEQEEAESEEAVETVEPEVEAEQEELEESTDEAESDGDSGESAEFSQEQIQAMQQELEELRAFKASQEKVQKEQIMESFENELTEEDLAPVKENLDSLTVDEVETQCFALLGKKKMNFSVEKSTANKEFVAIGSNFAQEDNTLPAWARAIQKHTSKRQ